MFLEKKATIVLQHNLNLLFTSVPVPLSISIISFESDSEALLSVNKRKTLPIVSIPLLPARPHIWRYSLEDKISFFSSLNLYISVNTTVLVGIFSPIEKEVVANRILINPREYNISIVSFKIGNRPEWCTPIPLNKISLISNI